MMFLYILLFLPFYPASFSRFCSGTRLPSLPWPPPQAGFCLYIQVYLFKGVQARNFLLPFWLGLFILCLFGCLFVNFFGIFCCASYINVQICQVLFDNFMVVLIIFKASLWLPCMLYSCMVYEKSHYGVQEGPLQKYSFQKYCFSKGLY